MPGAFRDVDVRRPERSERLYAATTWMRVNRGVGIELDQVGLQQNTFPVHRNLVVQKNALDDAFLYLRHTS